MASDFVLHVQPLFALANKSCTAYAFCFMIVTMFPEVYYKITGPAHPPKRGTGGPAHPPKGGSLLCL